MTPVTAVPPGPRRAAPAPSSNPVAKLLASRLGDWSVDGQDHTLMRRQAPVWNLLMDHYFRMDFEGWHRLPDEPTMLVGIHGGGSLTMDAWTVVFQWWRRFEGERTLHGTAHDVLMAAPGLGDYFKAAGVLPANGRAISAAFDAGHDVIIWPGGEVDAMRAWSKRDQVVLGGRKGFVKLAIRKGVPITPVATIGGHDTVFVLSEGRGLAKALGLKKLLRGEVCPVVLGAPFGVGIEVLPIHLPLPAKIRTELLDPVDVGDDPERAGDPEFVDRLYRQVEGQIQSGVDRLARRRSFPVFG